MSELDQSLFLLILVVVVSDGLTVNMCPINKYVVQWIQRLQSQSHAGIDLIFSDENCGPYIGHIFSKLEGLDYISVTTTRNQMYNSSYTYGNGNGTRIFLPSNQTEFWRMTSEVVSSGNVHVHQIILWPVESTNKVAQLEEEFRQTLENETVIAQNLLKRFGLNSKFFFGFVQTRQATFPEDDSCDVSIWEVYSLAQKLIIQQIPQTCGCGKLNSYVEPTHNVARRKDFEGQQIRITVANDSTGELEAKIVIDNGNLQLVNGSAVSLFWDLQFMMNFKYEVLEGDWINRFPNGTLMGITYNQLKNGTADMQLSLTSMLPYRASEFNFLQPTYYGGINAFFLQPPSSTIRNIYIAPFQFRLWASLFSTWCLILISVHFLGYIKKKYAEDSSMKARMDQATNESLIWAVGVTCQQSWHKTPSTSSLRIVFLCGTLTGFLSYIAYVAAIVSTLSMEVIPIRSFSSLLDSSFKIYAANDSSTMKIIIENLRAEQNNPKLGNFISVKQGVEFCQDKGHEQENAFLAFSHHFYRTARLLNTTTSVSLCKLSVLPVNIYPFQNGMLVTKDSPYREYFNHGIIRIKEVGLNFRYMKNYIRGTSTSCIKSNVRRSRLGLNDVFTAYVVLLTGYSTSIVLLICERVVFIAKSKSWILK